jgi:hypothetical protein
MSSQERQEMLARAKYVLQSRPHQSDSCGCLLELLFLQFPDHVEHLMKIKGRHA